MALHDLFPQPQQLTPLAGSITLRDRPILLVAAETDQRLQAVINLAQPHLPGGTAPPYRITVRLDPAHPAWAQQAGPEEMYLLHLDAEQGELVAATATGSWLGCQTLRQLLADQPETLPALRIVDWPDFRYRGLYVESKWGPDLMTLADWQGLIDYMAGLKFNSLGVGVYGCWVVQYGGETTEFLMLPFPDHPTLTAPKTLRYYSPTAEDWQTLTYLPRMATEDFFGTLVAYAKERNITVRPHFNAPGHNTLIPRRYPEVSALYADGSPIGYGFCLANPRSYELLFALYDSVIERYLRPHGIDWFHIGLDEVTGYLGIDPQRPFDVTEPWCQCPQCRDQPRARQLQEYAVRVCTHLQAQGIHHITLWNDALDSLGALNAEFVAQLAGAGLRDTVIVQWWRYQEPTLIPRRELGLRAWVTPMAGYWSNLFTQSYTANIYPMLLHGHRAGAEGADAYCIFDPAFDRNYTCLAQYAWNQRGEDLYQFKSRYARAKLGRWLDPALAVEAFEKYDQLFDAMSWTETVLASLLYYWHTYPAARRRGHYPHNVLSDLLAEHVRLRNAYQRLTAHARAARELFAQANQQAHNPLLAEYQVECEKLIGVWETFSLLLQGVDQYRQAVAAPTPATGARYLTQAQTRIDQAHTRLIVLLAALERVKQPFLLPQILRDLSVVLVYLEQLQVELAELQTALNTERSAQLPAWEELKVNQGELDRWVAGVQGNF